ncbi:hypothetical protein K432DRAFT_379272 [Lepidopterella palustris CBS 459.81]|uniref:Uncharacterized protein n=1 Tax=Lepidopterella palustris CBS 459.81 TaxID=1314670 RepID=A0A8E2EH67_9PEZI|nr:hypothetical protein K432DRAFT_379272 [Lepidopterella palustris CBS 459.81]
MAPYSHPGPLYWGYQHGRAVDISQNPNIFRGDLPPPLHAGPPPMIVTYAPPPPLPGTPPAMVLYYPYPHLTPAHGYHCPGYMGRPTPPPPASPGQYDPLQLPGGLHSGVNLLYGPEYTVIKRITGNKPPWEQASNFNFEFNDLKADCNWNIRQLINALRPNEDNAGWAVTQVLEMGHGKFIKGSTIPFDGDKGSQNLKDVGWTGRCGSVLPPVWVWVHKV